MIIIVFGNYNINLISNNEKYDIRKYNQKLNMSFTVNQGMNYIVLEIDSNNKINQKLKLEAQDKEIQFEAEEIYPYLLLEEKKDLALYINEIIEEQDDTKLEIDDYEKDKNYIQCTSDIGICSALFFCNAFRYCNDFGYERSRFCRTQYLCDHNPILCSALRCSYG